MQSRFKFRGSFWFSHTEAIQLTRKPEEWAVHGSQDWWEGEEEAGPHSTLDLKGHKQGRLHPLALLSGALSCLLLHREGFQLLGTKFSFLWCQRTPVLRVARRSLFTGAMPCPSESDDLVFFVNGRKVSVG